MADSSVSASPLGLILRHAYGFFASATLASAFQSEAFDHLARGAHDAETLANAAGISPRGAQALLDGLLGMGLIERTKTGYANVAELEPYLLKGLPTYLGGYAELILSSLPEWSRLPDAVTSGRPLRRREQLDQTERFWENLVRGVAPLTLEPARVAARELQLGARGPFRALDVGGGAGAFALVWLDANPSARVTQLDIPAVNAIARRYVAEFGAAERFDTIDGDMERVEIEPASFEYAIYSNMTHGLSAERNTAMLRRLRRWLKPGGTLVLSCMIPNEDRTGDGLLLMMSMNLLLTTESGQTYLADDYRTWLHASGFDTVRLVKVAHSASTLLLAS